MSVVECRKKISFKEAAGWSQYYKEKEEQELEAKRTNSLTDYYLMQNTMELRLLRSQWSKKRVKVKFEDFLLKFGEPEDKKLQQDFDQNIVKYSQKLKTSMPDIEKWRQSLMK